MSVPEVDAARAVRRRIRHEARDGLSVAAFSLGASVGLSALLWAALLWLA